MFGKDARRQRAGDGMAAPGYRTDFTVLDPELEELMLLEEAERAGALDAVASPPGDLGLDSDLQALEDLERAEREDH